VLQSKPGRPEQPVGTVERASTRSRRLDNKTSVDGQAHHQAWGEQQGTTR
jgi:hypothetical protein